MVAESQVKRFNVLCAYGRGPPGWPGEVPEQRLFVVMNARAEVEDMRVDIRSVVGY